MDYARIYEQLINRALDRILEGYVERHHIIPRCIGGSDDKSNIVQLTPEEHFLAHQLLVKLHPDSFALAKAVTAMCTHSFTEKRTTNKCFGWIRRKYAESQTGSGNHNFGRIWVNNGIEEMMITKELIPAGWVRGRLKSSMENNRKTHVGAKRSTSTREKIRLKAIGRPCTENQRRAIIESNKKRAKNYGKE